MSRARLRSLAVVALLAVVSAALVVVTPSLAHIVSRTAPHGASKPSWLWQSHVYGGSTASSTPHAGHRRRPYTPPVDRRSQP
jgi:hypothetical protein